jgi:alkanesulfonate monooxygenase SsuD/methylene tetrahydromethanopterin reductase-like flavin-dependent oxidoreductase (luciferase family)
MPRPERKKSRIEIGTGVIDMRYENPLYMAEEAAAADLLAAGRLQLGVQTVELAVAAEQVGIDGAFVRVHHFARQLSSPFPLLAAIGVRTSRTSSWVPRRSCPSVQHR